MKKAILIFMLVVYFSFNTHVVLSQQSTSDNVQSMDSNRFTEEKDDRSSDYQEQKVKLPVFPFIFLVLIGTNLVFTVVIIIEIIKTQNILLAEIKSLKTNSVAAKLNNPPPRSSIMLERRMNSDIPATRTSPAAAYPRPQTPMQPFLSNSGQTALSSAIRETIPQPEKKKETLASIVSQNQLFNNGLSALYSSMDLRDERRIKELDDIFLDIGGDAYQKMLQGEQVKLHFEKKGMRLSAPYVLIDNDSLYPNFYRYNEGKEIPRENELVIKEAFEIVGSLPGFVKICVPAKVSQKGGVYFITGRGKLELV